MTRRTTVQLFAAALLALPLTWAAAQGMNSAATTAPKGLLPLKMVSGFVMAVPPVAKDTAAFLVLSNPTAKDIVLVGATSNVAAMNTLMTHRMNSDGTTGMVGVKSLTVPAKGTLTMKPGGNHVMLMGLKRPLKMGEMVAITLRASDGRVFIVRAEVRKP